jgi:hydrogenase expression/formation protein HypD
MTDPGSLAFLDEFRSGPQVRGLLEQLRRSVTEPIKIMEVCGTHTMAISRHGIRQAVPDEITLISGPGCPVCVTANSDIDTYIELSLLPDVIAATFGDMLRVPGTRMGLAEARSLGAQVQVVYSTLDALKLARKNPDRKIIFFGVGFETTAPTVAAALLEARDSGLSNFFVQSVHKVVPPALKALSSTPELSIDAYLCPGHVTAIIGPEAYQPIADDFELPCVIAGFEPTDIIQAMIMIARQFTDQRSEVEIQYTRGVKSGGNPAARALMDSVFAPCDAEWRGLGLIPGSGLALRDEFSDHDALLHFEVDASYSREPKGCLCGAILTGQKTPPDCGLFGKSCVPEHPVGPCMVSSEGTCAAYYQYEI